MFNSDQHSLPIFIQPQEIVIVKSNPETYRQLLTLINPFDFILHYKILSNAPSKFKLQEPNGFLRPKCAVDIVFRHLSPENLDSTDCLRVEVFREAQSSACGRKDIRIHVMSNEVRRPTSEEFRSFPTAPSSSRNSHTRPHASFIAEQPNQNLFWFAILACTASIITIMLPTYNDQRTNPATFIPIYMHPTANLQLVAAYALGIITVYLMRQNN